MRMTPTLEGVSQPCMSASTGACRHYREGTLACYENGAEFKQRKASLDVLSRLISTASFNQCIELNASHSLILFRPDCDFAARLNIVVSIRRVAREFS